MAQLQMQQAQFSMLSGNPLGALANLKNAFEALGGGAAGFQQFGGGLSPFGAMPSPTSMLPIMGPLCGGGYSAMQRIDLAPGSGNGVLSQIFDPNRRAAGQFERLLNSNPFVRSAFENSIGGRLVNDGRNDGVLTVQRFLPQDGGMSIPPGFGLNPLAQSAGGIFGQMGGGILGKLAMLGGGIGAAGGLLGGLAMGNPFMGLVMGGLSGALGGLGMGAQMGAMGGLGMGMGGMGMGGLGMGGMGGGILPPFGFGFGMLGGQGMGSFNPLAMPGHINNTNPAVERAHQMQVSSVLNDPSLTVEDKVTLMLMLITKKMDRDIENQTQYINSIQQQQGNRQGKGKGLGLVGGVAGAALGGPAGAKVGSSVGGKIGNGGNNSAPSIDVETLKLQRMVTKRQQMFDMLKAIIDKYNETAKGVIQSLGR
ncbi:MAG: hypothetical protein HY791_11325 [Deltaproteobacteria bacterium]|nr:hypothetical protein [Deltaproteobacteria bacterium]